MDSSPTPISTEDLDMLNSSAMMNTFEHDLLLSGLGGSSFVSSIGGDEFSSFLEHHTDKWNLSSEPIIPSTWNPTIDHHSKLQQDSINKEAPKNQWWSSEPGNAPKTVYQKPNIIKGQGHSHGNLKAAINFPEDKNGSFASMSNGLPVFRRSRSAVELSKQFDSSDNSDAMEDDDGSKLSPSGKTPASKNLVSERRRRRKLNERLYSLRALVPKISKMDKASIVSDAISYVQDLQKQVDEMQADILCLQSSKDSPPSNGEKDGKASTCRNAAGNRAPEHRIIELDVLQMEEQTYHLRIHCKKGPGLLVQLTQALEALDFEIINANLTAVSDNVLNTIVMKAKNGEVLKAEDVKKLTLEVVPKFGLVADL